MIDFQSPAFPDLNNFCNKKNALVYKAIVSLSSELYIATALETQEHANVRYIEVR